MLRAGSRTAYPVRAYACYGTLLAQDDLKGLPSHPAFLRQAWSEPAVLDPGPDPAFVRDPGPG